MLSRELERVYAISFTAYSLDYCPLGIKQMYEVMKAVNRVRWMENNKSSVRIRGLGADETPRSWRFIYNTCLAFPGDQAVARNAKIIRRRLGEAACSDGRGARARRRRARGRRWVDGG